MQPPGRTISERVDRGPLNADAAEEVPEGEADLLPREVGPDDDLFVPLGTDLADRPTDLAQAPGLGSRGDGVQLSPWLVLRPSYRFSGFYDSNVTRAPEDEESDVELNNSIALDLTAVRERYTVTVGYAYTRREFLDLTQFNSDEHRGRILARAEWTRLRLQVRGTVADLSRPGDPRFVNTAAVDRLLLDALIGADYAFTERLGVRAEGLYQSQDFSGNRDNLDYRSFGINGFGTYQTSGPLRFLVGGGYTILEYTAAEADNADLVLVSLQGGVEADFDRLDFMVRAGYVDGRVTEDRAPAGQETDPPSGLTVTGRGVWEVLVGTRLALEVNRGVDFSSARGSQFTTRVTLGATSALTQTLAAFSSVSWQQQDPQDAADEFGTISAFLLTTGMTWDPAPWVQLGWQAGWESRSVSGGVNEGQGDYDIFRLGVSVTLRL